MLTLALILGYIDSMIPMPVPVAGIKLGLANLVILYGIYRLKVTDTILISLIRVILSGLMFAGLSGIIFSMAGAVLSLAVMYIMKRFTNYHIITISVCGSLAHIMGQLIVAGSIMGMNIIPYYAPILMLSALLAGAIIGILDTVILDRTAGINISE